MKEDVTRALSANVALIHTNLIRNTEEHERDNRKDQRGHGRSSGRAQVVGQDANMTVPTRPSSCGNLFLS